MALPVRPGSNGACTVGADDNNSWWNANGNAYLAKIRAATLANPQGMAFGQQSNGCWHILKWDPLSTGANKKTKSMYPRYFEVVRPPTIAECGGNGKCLPIILNCKTYAADGKTCSVCNPDFNTPDGGKTCVANTCSCPNGIVSTPCADPTNKPCKSCHTGYTGDKCNACASGFIMDQAGKCVSTIKDCKTYTAQGACQLCNNGYYLSDPHTCSVNKCTCLGGTAATGPACTTNNAKICTKCSSGFVQDGTNCAPDISNCKTQKGTSCTQCNDGYYTSDGKICSVIECACNNGTPAAWPKCSSANANICQECKTGFYKTDDNKCMANVCKCVDGSAATGAACTANGANICQSCKTGFPGYVLKQGACVKPNQIPHCKTQEGNKCMQCNNNYTLNDGITCVLNKCTCKNGTPAAGTACPRNGANRCQSCKTNYTLNENKCIQNQCTCPNGTAATGSTCTQNGAKQCISCKYGYKLDNKQCEPVNYYGYYLKNPPMLTSNLPSGTFGSKRFSKVL